MTPLPVSGGPGRFGSIVSRSKSLSQFQETNRTFVGQPTKVCLAAVLLFALPGHAVAGEATDAVKAFYDYPGLELESSARDRFIDPARKVLDQYDAIKASGSAEGCLDPNLPFDDTDYDLAEVTKSLKLAERVNGEDAKVVVAFKVPDGVARLEWKLRNIDGKWKVADIISMTKDWALSQFNCE
jgi:hypothetical protein